ncbi:MAG: response regulator transcription factor [Pedobacter sp.]|uniref:response regulator n=1 Tax=Pedobacter sp. TaxID=1411316 RepID=UPI0033916DD9
MEEERTAIAIVDDHTLFRKGLVSLLNESDEVEILFDAANGLELKQIMSKDRLPEVILMDINMPQMDGYATTKWVRKTYPSVKVLALSIFDEDNSIVEMLKSGAGGYLRKESRASEMITAIKSIAANG